MKSNVNHPKHYNSDPSGIECIEVVRHRNFNIGNAIKYLWRAGLKDEPLMDIKQKTIEDLEKSIFYIKDEIERLKDSPIPFVPQTGDFLSTKDSYCMIMIYKGLDDKNRPLDFATYNVPMDELTISGAPWEISLSEFRPASDSEKNLLISKLDAFGKVWNINKKQVEDKI